MMHMLVIAGLVAIALVSIAKPWIGVVTAYLFVVLTPQNVWYWDFEGVRPELWILVPTGFGVMAGLMTGRFDIATLRTKRNLFILILWICSAVSYYFGAYVDAGGPWRFEDPSAIFAIVNKIMILYFMACLCIDTERKVKALFYVICASAIYMIYWANDKSITGQVFGRLAGPTNAQGQGIYHDENAFAMLFVVAQSFLWYFGASFRRRVWRWGTWLLIPLCWNAVFLTASRGGLLGLGVSTLLIALRSKKRVYGLALIPIFLLAFAWKGGTLMHDRAGTITSYQTNESSQDRIEAWRAAWGMIKDHPLVGVGLASFGPAYPHYATSRPHEAHDTLLQIAADSGALAGLMYVLIVVTCVNTLWKTANARKKRAPEALRDSIRIVSDATLIAFCGLVVCSLFLSLQIFEIFYCLNVLANAIEYLDRKSQARVDTVRGAMSPSQHALQPQSAS